VRGQSSLSRRESERVDVDDIERLRDPMKERLLEIARKDAPEIV
jgi:hypothetical protein